MNCGHSGFSHIAWVLFINYVVIKSSTQAKTTWHTLWSWLFFLQICSGGAYERHSIIFIQHRSFNSNIIILFRFSHFIACFSYQIFLKWNEDWSHVQFGAVVFVYNGSRYFRWNFCKKKKTFSSSLFVLCNEMIYMYIKSVLNSKHD